jgi:outer membrane immunogenic protein
MKSWFVSLLSGSAILVMVGSASAADWIVEEGVPIQFDIWSGLYAGAQIGYGWGDTDRVYVDTYSPPSLSIDGMIGGVHFGYNHRINDLVVGVEGDFSFTGISGSGADDDTGYALTSDIDWISTIRGRVGVVASDQFLIYGTAGLAVADINHSIQDITLREFNDTYTGWTIGAGAEYALSKNITLRGEYRYHDFGEKSFEPVGDWLAHDFEAKVSTVTFGVSYHF